MVPLLPSPALLFWPGASRLRGALVGVGLAAVVGLAPKAVGVMSGATHVPVSRATMLLDLAGLYAQKPKTFAGSTLARYMTPEDLRRNYDPAGIVALFSTVSFHEFVRRHSTEIRREWVHAIVKHPRIYVANRLRFFGCQLGITDVHYPYHTGILPNRFGLVLEGNTQLHGSLLRVQNATGRSLLFRGWVWMLLSTVIVALGAVGGQRLSLAFAVACSGWLYGASLAIVGPSADFRYLFWTIVSVFAAITLLSAEARLRAESRLERP